MIDAQTSAAIVLRRAVEPGARRIGAAAFGKIEAWRFAAQVGRSTTTAIRWLAAATGEPKYTF